MATWAGFRRVYWELAFNCPSTGFRVASVTALACVVAGRAVLAAEGVVAAPAIAEEGGAYNVGRGRDSN